MKRQIYHPCPLQPQLKIRKKRGPLQKNLNEKVNKINIGLASYDACSLKMLCHISIGCTNEELNRC